MIENLAKPDNDKKFIATGKNNQLNAFYTPDLQYTTLGKFIIFRLKEDRDLKMLITGSGKTTGTGKTTLAIHIARFVMAVRNYLFDETTEWTSKEYSFMNVHEYLKKYSESEKGIPLITDELEYMADRRRHMTHENVKFSQAWSILRYRNIVTIGTAPGLSDLEKRLPEGADIWLNVLHKGRAYPYYLTMHDFKPERIIKRLRTGRFKDEILWNPIESDEDYQWLKDAKEDLGVPGIDDSQEKQIDESDLNQLEKDLRNDYVKETIRFIEDKEVSKYFTQGDIADMAKVSQPQVSKIYKEMVKNGEIDGGLF